MDHDILENTIEEVTEGDKAQNDSSASPSGPAAVEQKPVQNDTGGNDGTEEVKKETPSLERGEPAIPTLVVKRSKPAARNGERSGGEGEVPTLVVKRSKPAARNGERNETEPQPQPHIVNENNPKPPAKKDEWSSGEGEVPTLTVKRGKPKPAEEERREENVPTLEVKRNKPEEENGEHIRNGESGTLDEIAAPMRALAMENEGIIQEGGEADGSFDTLQELKELKSNQPEEPQNNENGAADLLKKVNEARRGNIYSAVVLAKGLENHQSNPFASGRASRFFNSSKIDKALDVNKLAMGANGIASSWDKEYADSKLGNSISLVVNMIALVGSLRDLVKKIKGFRNMPKWSKEMEASQKKGAIRDNAFAVLGIISDAATILLRVCGVAKAIAGLAGQGKSVFAKVTGYVSLALGGFTQIVGLSSSVNQMLKLKENRKKVADARDKAGEKVDRIKEKYFPEAERPQAEEPGEGGEPENDGAPAQEKKTGASAGRTRAEIAVLLMEQGGVTEEEKDVLTGYLMLERKAGKLNEQLMNGIFGLTTLSTGLISTITGSVSAGLKEKTETDEDKKRSDKANLANQIVGTVSNGAVIVGASKNLTQGVMKKVKEKNPSSAEKVLQNRVKDVLEEMKEKKYGLRGIAQGLQDDPNDEQKAAATQALEKYAAADKRLQGLGVDYGVLLKAHDEKAFEKALIAGI
ncbi:hypothetical protein AALD74_07165 [Lachnospiraceae bacterium 48-21]|jgi:hypothetical protein|nr:hypothetical protein [Dorea sp.]